MNDEDILKLINFVDWFSPTKEINEDLQNCIKRIKTKLVKLNRIENAPLHRINYNNKGVITYDKTLKGNGTFLVIELQDM